jgi:NTP pyrophosphatase (non-canonical NTP hydrolase)
MIFNMTIKEYSIKARETANYKDNRYPATALIEEIGELSGKFAKWYRGDYKDLPITEIKKELGDICWESNEYHCLNGRQIEITYSTEDLTPFVDYLDFCDRLCNFRFNLGLIGIIAMFLRQYPEFGTIEEILELNIAKLADRKNSGKIKGDGDNR